MAVDDAGDGPEESNQFARHRRDCDHCFLSGRKVGAKSGAEAKLGFPGGGDDLLGLTVLAGADGGGHLGW